MSSNCFYNHQDVHDGFKDGHNGFKIGLQEFRFAKMWARENCQNLNKNCGQYKWPTALVWIPADCFSSQDSKKVQQSCVAQTVPDL